MPAFQMFAVPSYSVSSFIWTGTLLPWRRR